MSENEFIRDGITYVATAYDEVIGCKACDFTDKCPNDTANAPSCFDDDREDGREIMWKMIATPSNIEKPKLHSIWRNKKSGKLYQVYDFTNEATDRPDEYPVRVSYRRLEDKTCWSRSLSDWHRSYEFSVLGDGPL